jgi:hypothetical protein
VAVVRRSTLSPERVTGPRAGRGEASGEFPRLSRTRVRRSVWSPRLRARGARRACGRGRDGLFGET